MALMERRRKDKQGGQKPSRDPQAREDALPPSPVTVPAERMPPSGTTQDAVSQEPTIPPQQVKGQKRASLADLASRYEVEYIHKAIEALDAGAPAVQPEQQPARADENAGLDETPDIEELPGDEYDELTDMERDVLRVAKGTLKKKKFPAEIGFDPYTPMVEKMLSDCIAKFHVQKGYSKESIIATIKALEEQHWIVTSERRTKEEILQADLYKQIIGFIEKNPGVHARDERIQSELGITRNPFLKHMIVLERFNIVKKRKQGKLWNFYSRDFPDDDTIAELVVVLYNDIARQLVRLLLQDPGSTLVDLARRIIPPVYHGAIQYHLKKFEELGLVVLHEQERRVNDSMLARYNAVVSGAFKIA